MKKGTIKTGFSNIKPVAGTQATGLAMQVGDYCYGEVSVTGSDMIGFDHFYRVTGSRIELGQVCKANASNMTIVTEEESGTTLPPPPPPAPDPASVKEILDSVITYRAYNDSIHTVRLTPE